MESLLFNFRPKVVPERQDEILAELKAKNEISSAGHIAPDSTDPELLRACFAYVKKGANRTDVVKSLLKYPEIESVRGAPQRVLIW